MTEIHWLNPVSDNFNIAADWSGGSVPIATDDAVIAAKGAHFKVTASTSEMVNSIQLGRRATLLIQGGTFTALEGTGGGANAGTISIGNGKSLVVGGGVQNTGEIDLNSRSSATSLQIGAAGATLTGGGVVTLGDGKGNEIIASVAGSATLTNVDNTIAGSGLVGVSGGRNLNLVNEAGGVIDGTGRFYLGGAGSESITNTGLIEATTGFVQVNGAVTNAGGVILAGAGASVVFQNADITGGALLGSGEMVAVGTCAIDGSASMVNIGCRLAVQSATPLGLLGAIANSAIIDVFETGITIGPATTLSGGGTIDLASANVFIKGHASTDVLTNADNTIAGEGQIGYAKMTLVNLAGGVIDADGPGSLNLDTQGAAVTNDGLIEATGEGVLFISGTTLENGAGGIVLAGAGSQVNLNGAVIQGGTLKSVGSGVITEVSTTGTLDGTSEAITSQAAIFVGLGSSLTVEGALNNVGEIKVSGGGRATATLIVGGPDMTLSGGGSIVLSRASVVKGASSTATLTNIDNTIAGVGQLGAGVLTLVNQSHGVIDAIGDTTLTIDTGANTIANAGTIECDGPGGAVIASAVNNTGVLWASFGSLVVNGAVSGDGSALISGGVLDFASTFNQSVIFNGSKGVLELAQSQGFSATVSGFSTSDGTSLDLSDIGFVDGGEASFSGTATSGVLTVTDGTHTARITLEGDYRSAVFTASSDGHGGAVVVANTSGGARPNAFVTAMAGLGASEGAAIHLGLSWSPHPPPLAASRTMTA